jgi:hypothetical protein
LCAIPHYRQSDFLRRAKESREKEKGALANGTKERQTTLMKTATTARPKSPKPDLVYTVASNYVEKQQEPKNELMEAYTNSWKVNIRASSSYSTKVVAECMDYCRKLLAILTHTV